jgi:hypothetical protein
MAPIVRGFERGPDPKKKKNKKLLRNLTPVKAACVEKKIASPLSRTYTSARFPAIPFNHKYLILQRGGLR